MGVIDEVASTRMRALGAGKYERRAEPSRPPSRFRDRIHGPAVEGTKSRGAPNSENACYVESRRRKGGETIPSATEIFHAHLAGDRRAHGELVSLLYEELRALAECLLHREGPGAIQATELVHEAFLRLIEQDRVDWRGRTHFFALAATSMRRVLVDQARARLAGKRGGGSRREPMSDSLAVICQDPGVVLAVHEALEELARQHPRQARLVELRFFSGMGMCEIASVLGIHRNVATMDWRFARAWLNARLSDRRDEDA